MIYIYIYIYIYLYHLPETISAIDHSNLLTGSKKEKRKEKRKKAAVTHESVCRPVWVVYMYVCVFVSLCMHARERACMRVLDGESSWASACTGVAVWVAWVVVYLTVLGYLTGFCEPLPPPYHLQTPHRCENCLARSLGQNSMIHLPFSFLLSQLFFLFQFLP